MLFADDAVVATNTRNELQPLIDRFSQACRDFGLTISLKKTNIVGHDTETMSSITIDDYELYDVCHFTYDGYTFTPTTSDWTQISIRGLAMQLQQSLVSRCECGHDVGEDKDNRLRCIKGEKANQLQAEKHP